MHLLSWDTPSLTFFTPSLLSPPVSLSTRLAPTRVIYPRAWAKFYHPFPVCPQLYPSCALHSLRYQHPLDLIMSPNADEYRGNRVLAAAIFCTVLSTLSFLGRIWGRSLSATKLGREDLLMTFAMVSSTKGKIIREGMRLTDFRLVVGRLPRSTY